LPSGALAVEQTNRVLFALGGLATVGIGLHALTQW
jgi:hypothetical protein